MSTNSPTDIPDGRDIMRLFAVYLLKLLERANAEEGEAIGAPMAAVINKFCTDNSITLASIRKGDFGVAAKDAAEQFPFNDDGSVRGDVMMGAIPHLALVAKPN